MELSLDLVQVFGSLSSLFFVEISGTHLLVMLGWENGEAVVFLCPGFLQLTFS